MRYRVSSRVGRAAAALVLALAAITLPPAAVSAPGKPSSETALSIGTVVERTLPNGLTVLVWPRRTAPVVTTQIWYRVGSRDELPGATGLAHFLEHLLFKGTRKYKKGEIDRLTYRNGGTNNAFTFNDYTAYEFNFPKSTWKTALEIEAERMRNCVFDNAEFEAEREVVMEERRGEQDDPASRFGEQLSTVLWLAHPYRNPVVGWMEDLKRVTRDEVYAFYRRYYVPANATLVITGDVTPEEAVAAAREAFAGLPKLPAPPRRVVPEPERVDGARHLRAYLPTQVPRLSLAFQAPKDGTPDFYALWIMTYVLAEGNLSRLHRRLVDRDQLATEVDGYVGGYREAGEMGFNAVPREGVPLERLEGVIWDELGRIASEPVTERELERARNQFYSRWVHGLETANEMATVLGEASAVTHWRNVGKVAPAILGVTAADVRRVARTYARRERAVIGYLYPRPPEAERRPARGSRPSPAFRGPLARRACRAAGARGAAAASPTFPPLKPLEKVLPNGLRLVLLENHDLPSVTLSARVDAGSYRDPDGKTGLASFAARMLDQGTASRTYEDIQADLEQVGASFSASARKETTSVDLVALSRHAPDLLPLFTELLTRPSFPADRLELERTRILTALKDEEDDAETVARKAFFQLVFQAHPGSRPISGTPGDVRRITRDDLLRFHARFFRPEATTLVAVGDFSAPEMLARLADAFSGWEKGAEPPAPLPQIRKQAEVRTRRITMDKTQTQIFLGHLGIRRDNPDYTALRVLDTILGEGVGGGFTARIPYQLRDVQGLAYSVGSSITGSAAREPGVFVAAMGVAPGKEKAAVSGLLKEIARIRSQPVTPEELKEAKDYLVNSYVFDFQSQGQLASYLQITQYYGLGYNHRQGFTQAVRKITAADVQRVARQYLDPDHYTLVVVGPEETKAP